MGNFTEMINRVNNSRSYWGYFQEDGQFKEQNVGKPVSVVYRWTQIKFFIHNLKKKIQEKRDIFPRFLFLSDEDLLEIIGHSSRESVAQSKFKKLFTGIDSVQLSTNNDKILAVCSSEGESVPLLNPVDIKKPIEEWLSDLSKATQNTLRDLLFKCQHEKLAPDPLKYPAQILCLSNHIDFTMKCEQAITGLSLPVLLAKYKAQLNELFCLDLKNDIEIDRKNDSVLELKYKALFLDNIHHTRILEELLNENVTHLSNWVWLKQLRFYIGSNGDVIIKMGKAELNYAYEYLGNLPKLVRTPLIERCFLTLTQAMHLGLGGNLYGPAGTGKTESVKTLGSVLGRHVIVFNCDESIDADSLERMLTGIVKIGAWGCFDEFNRLGETTLSAVSMMIKSIQEALKNNLSTVKLLNQTVPVNKFCGVFVTLNPAGGSYGGRKKLPDNLKQLFRPVVMKLPYNKEIVRTCLTCDGYQHAEKIAQKIVEVFEMSSKIMSKKQHYDWGLRAIKSVVSSCQMRLKKYKMSQKVENNLSLNEELSIASSVLREEIISKLTSRDCIKFDDLLNIVFKEIEVDIKRDENEYIKKAVLESIKDFNLVVNERQVSKCLEFHNHINQRIGVAIIGPPSSGKSTIIKIVSKALNKINKRVNVYNVNPKSMTRQHLLGYTDYLNQWNNGVLINYALQAAEESEDVWSWIVCDGDMDPDWIESLNSALDDNKLLTLPSGCRINFNSNVNFIFETHDVQNASPATISRLGVVYLDSEDLPLPVYSRNLLNCLEESQRMFLEPLVNKFLLSGIKWISSNGKTSVYRSDISIARTSFVHIKEVGTELHFLVNLIHGLGQQLRQNRREKFAKQIFKWAQEDMPTFNVEESYYDPEKNIIADYKAHLDIEEANIENGIPLIKIGKVLKYIHTIQTYLVSGNEEHFLLCGPHGAAKRLMVNYIARTRSEFKTVIIPCCPNFTTEFVIYQIQQHCISVSTLHGNLLRPRIGHILLYFRNIHLLKMDVWGSNILIEFLRQLVEYNGFYDQKAEFVRVQNITVIGTMLPTNQISPRFLSKLHLINIDLPEMEDLSTITMTYLSRIVKTHFPALNCSKMQIKKLAYTMITVFEKAVEFFKAIHLNYVQLSPHDLTQWCTNIKNYSISMEEIELIEVVYFEARKIFTDRVMKQESKIEMDILIDNVFKANWGDNSLMNKELNSYFVFDQSIIKEKQMLKKFSKDDWQLEVKRGLTEYGNDDRKLNIVITSEILLLISTIMRVTALSEHNLVLIGKGGIGRKTSIKIASALSSSQIFHPHSGEYPLFNHELILAIQCAGVQCQNVFLILEDNIFLNDQNLASVNLLLATSDIGHLFKSIEMESIIKGLKEKYDTEDIEELFIILVNNIKNNLHVFVCLDQDNSNLRNIFLKCPALLHNCYGIWLDTWSEDTIKLFPIKLGELLGEDETVRNNSNFELIYKSLPNFIPLKYIYMIKLYYVICDEKKTSILSKMLKLQGGVSKLSSAKKLVVELRKKAESQQDQLADKQSKANVALEMISKTIEGANTQKEEMEILRKKTQEENVELVARKTEIEKELAEVEPLIRKASAAVGTIKSESLSEIRSLRAPPEIIRDILEGVLKLMGIQDTSWNSMKIFLAKRGVKEEIRSFDASCITQENLNAVENLLKTKRESYEISNAKRASVAAAPLATWVDANVKYSRVLSKIKPLEQEQQKLQRNLENAESQLAQLNVNLLDVKSSVTKLKDQLSLYTKEAAEIEVELKEVSQTLTAAETLVSKLQDEYERWQIQLEELSEELDSSSHNCLLAAAYMVFLSETTESLRRSLIQKWCTESRIKKDFMFKDFFYSENDKLNWELEGLPTNRTAIENAIIIKKGILTPLLIDPTSTILKWLRNHFRQTGQHFEYINYKALKFNTILEASMRFGKILLVEEIDDAFHALLPLLREEFIYEGERRLIDLLGKKVDCNIKFKLVMCSKNEQLSIPAAVAPFLNVLRFDITHSEFTEQLLSAAILQEKPELDLKRKELLQQQEELQKQLEILRDRLLECLASSDDNILENKNLLNTLNETKTNSVAVWKAIEESKNIQLKLREDYEIFLDISSFASKLYIACREFTKYNRLYSWSTQYYKKLFLQCLNSFQVYQENSMNEKVIQFVYENMSQGVFKSDKIAFLLHLVYKMFPSQIPENEINVFLGKAEYTESENSKEDTSDLPTWLPTYCKSKIQFIKKCLPDLFNKCQFIDKSNWVTFLNSSTCEKEFPLFCKLTEFQKLLIIQSLRPDKLLTAMSNCVSHITGLKTIELPILNLHKTFKESTALEPILLITTAGMEPSDDIRNLAKQINIEYEEVSLAESQQTNALVFLQECKTGGKWLILKNIHLVLNWIPILFERLTGSFDDINSDFRLWLISESVHNLDPVFIQNCIKIVYEEPDCLAHNIQKNYASFSEKFDKKIISATSARIFFAFTFLHALLQGRRKYIPQGWTKYYEFNHTDLLTCLILMEDNWNTNTTRVQWEVIKGITCEAVYGGRIEDEEDLKILETYSNIYFNENILSQKWNPLDLNFNLPMVKDNKEYMKIIKTFPKQDHPHLFGLPANIEKTREKQISSKLILNLKGFYINQRIEDGYKLQNLQIYFKMWKELNQDRDYTGISISKEFSGKSSIERFIHEEYYFGIILIQRIHKCLTILNKISKGILEDDEDYIVMAKFILQYQTPPQWLSTWRGPEDPSQYLQQVIRNMNYVSTWRENMEILLRQPIKLSLFFEPQAFLASSRQDYARTAIYPLENIVLRISEDNSDNGILLSDLYVEGALYANKTLSQCTPESDSINIIPTCYLCWCNKEEYVSNEVIEVPLYSDSSRDFKIINLEILSEVKEKQKWILSGLSFYLRP